MTILSTNLTANNSLITAYTPYFLHSVRKYKLLICGATNEMPEKRNSICCSSTDKVIRYIRYNSLILFFGHYKGNNFCDFLFAYQGDKSFQTGSTHKRKNLLP